MTGTFEIKSALRVAIAAAALAAALVLPAQALAANDCSSAASDPTAAQYCNSTHNVAAVPAEEGGETKAAAGAGGEGSGPGGGEVSSASAGGGSLPFTGVDLLALAAVAAAFVAIGFALRRLSTSRPGAAG